jgi:hypothetical protein
MNSTRAVPWEREPPPGSTRIGQIETAVREAASQWGHEIGPGRPRQAFAPSGVEAVRAAILAGSLLAALGLGWIAGSTLHGFFSPGPTPPPFEQARASKSDLTSDKETIVGTSRTSPAAAQQAIPSPGPTSATVQHHASRAAPPVVDGRAKILPVPETRPTTVAGWVVRDVAGGTAVLEGPNGVWRRKAGETVPGVGRIDFIVRWGSRWIVGTSRGLITTP